MKKFLIVTYDENRHEFNNYFVEEESKIAILNTYNSDIYSFSHNLSYEYNDIIINIIDLD